MNDIDISLKIISEPREVATTATSTVLKIDVVAPPASYNKVETVLTLDVYGKQKELFSAATEGALMQLHDASLRYDVENKTFYLQGGRPQWVDESAPILNRVVLAGRCIKDLDLSDTRVFKQVSTGLVVCNQTLSVPTGKKKSDLFNFYAMSDASTGGFNTAELIANRTRKGTPVTLKGMLVTDGWTDKRTGDYRTNSKICVNKVDIHEYPDTAKPAVDPPQTPERPEHKVWRADPWTKTPGPSEVLTETASYSTSDPF
jgi:hypothetical protein